MSRSRSSPAEMPTSWLSKPGTKVLEPRTRFWFSAVPAVERDAVEHAGVVDVHGVAVLRGTLHGDEAGVLLAQALDVAVNLFVGDFNGGLLRLKALILGRG